MDEVQCILLQAMAFLEENLQTVSEAAKSGWTYNNKDPVVHDVAAVAQTYSKVHAWKRHFRPVQLASILLNVRAAELGSGGASLSRK